MSSGWPSLPYEAWNAACDTLHAHSLAVSLFSGEPATPPTDDFIARNAMDSEKIAIGWWPGDLRHPHAAFYAYVHPAPAGFETATLSPAAARWDDTLGGSRPPVV